MRTTLTLALALLLAKSAAAATTLELKNGDKVSGTVVSRDAREVVVDHPVLGRLTIPAEQLVPDTKPGMFGTSFLEGWDRSLSLGLTGSEGNSQETSFQVGMDFESENETRRWEIRGDYKLSTSDGETDDHFGHLASRRDWLFGDSVWFALSSLRYDYDEFERWKHRATAEGGPGYHWIRGGPWKVNLLSGLALTYEFGDGGQLRPEAYVGFETTWKVNAGQQIRFSDRFYQQLDADEYRNLTRAEWRMRVLGSEHLSLSLGVDNEYDSAAEGDRNSLKYWTNLNYHY